MREDTKVAGEEVPESGVAQPRVDVIPAGGDRLRPCDAGFDGECVLCSMR